MARQIHVLARDSMFARIVPFTLFIIFVGADTLQQQSAPAVSSAEPRATPTNKRHRGNTIPENSNGITVNPEIVDATTKLIRALNANAVALGHLTRDTELQRQTELNAALLEKRLAAATDDPEIFQIVADTSEELERTSNVLASVESSSSRDKGNGSKNNHLATSQSDIVARSLSLIALLISLIGTPILCRYYLTKGLKKAGLM